MTRDWESVFSTWAKGPGASEQERCDNAVRAVRTAIEASEKLKRRNIQVFLQGSYRNHTNVRQESDVDVGVLCFETFFHDLPDGFTREDFRIEPATYKYAQYKNEVGEALASHFGPRSVTRGNKAFDIRENTYRVDADVIACFEHRRYSPDGSYESGVQLVSDRGDPITN